MKGIARIHWVVLGIVFVGISAAESSEENFQTLQPGVEHLVFKIESIRFPGKTFPLHVIRVDPNMATIKVGLASLQDGQKRTAKERAEKETYSVVINRALGRRYFGTDNPIGKTLNIDGGSDFTVTGILDDVPANSHLKFDLLLSFETLYAQSADVMAMWNRIAYFTYVLLAENADPHRVEQATQVMVNKYMGELLRSRGATQELFLQPLTDIHLRSRYEEDPFARGQHSVRLLLLCACPFHTVGRMPQLRLRQARLLHRRP
jgi:hypothetical protein